MFQTALGCKNREKTYLAMGSNGSYNPVVIVGASFCLSKVKRLQAVEDLKLKYGSK